MKKLLLLIPVLALAACGQKSYTYEAFYDIEGTGKAELTETKAGKVAETTTVDLPIKGRGMFIEGIGKVAISVKPETGDATCKFRLEHEKEITNSGNPATCSYDITESTDN